MASDDTLGSVLVLGGCGFLGHHIVQKLLEASDVFRVTVLDLDTGSNQRKGANYLTSSITSRSDLESALQQAQPRVIFHTVSPQALGSSQSFMKVNVEGTRNLLDCIERSQSNNAKALVYTSSSSVVHVNWSDLAGVTEYLPRLLFPQQTELYSHTKALAEEMVLEAKHSIPGLRTCAIHPAGMFGEGDLTTAGNINASAKEGNHKIQIGDNSKLFDWTYVGNNAHAQILAARALLRSHLEPKPADQRVDGEAFVITNDDPWPL